MNRTTMMLMTVAAGVLAMTVLTAGVSAEEADSEAMPEAKAGMMMDEATMARMQEYSTPGEAHKVLEYFVGDWDYSMKWWMAPDTPPEESTGAGKITSIMGGRYIDENFKGTAMGQPFHGRGTLGYDNLKKEYVFTWVDNMSTGIMTSSGQYDEDSMTLTESGSHTCPLSESGTRAYRAVTKIIDDDSYTYEVFTPGPDGKEFKSMSIAYKRKS